MLDSCLLIKLLRVLSTINVNHLRFALTMVLLSSFFPHCACVRSNANLLLIEVQEQKKNKKTRNEPHDVRDPISNDLIRIIGPVNAFLFIKM